VLAILVSLETPLELGGKIAEVARVRLLSVNSLDVSVETTPVSTRKAALIAQKLLGLVLPVHMMHETAVSDTSKVAFATGVEKSLVHLI